MIFQAVVVVAVVVVVVVENVMAVHDGVGEKLSFIDYSVHTEIVF